MTVEMSSEGESAKSALSEANEKSGSDNHTDTSQDSADANAKPQKATVENNVEKKENDEKPKGETEESEQEPEQPEKDEPDLKKDDEKKEVDAPKKEEPKKEEEKENDKQAKGEDSEDKEEEEEEEVDEEEEVEEEEEEDEGSEKDEKKKKKGKKGVPLLDQPLETSGKRERKSVQRLEVAPEQKEPTKIEFENGSGTALGEIPRVEASITRFKTDDSSLKHLHRILFKTIGKPNLIKRNIKKFNGFEFKRDSEDYRKKVEIVKKLEVKSLKSICEILDLTKTGSKDDMSERILDFLMDPKDSGKPLPGGRPKRASAIRANNRGYSSHDDYSSDEKHSRARRDKGKRPNLKDDSSSDEEFRPDGDASEASDEGARPPPRVAGKRRRAAGRPRKRDSSEDEDEASPSDSEDSDFEEGPRSKQRRKSATKVEAKPKRGPAGGRGRGRPKAAAAAAAAPAPAKKAPGRRGRKPKESSEGEEDDSDRKDGAASSSEDEPLAKKVKNADPPTDDEIKAFIKSVLEGANLEEITMKTVCQRVYDHYPDFDLSHKKDFIKTTVKSLIST